MISIKSLHKYYNKNRQNEIHVINDINLDLPDKGMVALFGRSGCGKTTLLNAIGGLDRTESGSILIDGKDARKNPDVIRNQYIGYIFQNYNLNNQQTCFENVANALLLCGMTDKAEIEERVLAALANVGMEKYKSRTPDTLSGGQQQRIAIARAIVKNPSIILADEPTGNLDEANTLQVMDLLKKIAETHLVILVTHEAHLVDYYCDKVIELSDGKVVSTRDNFAANGLAARSKNDIYLGEYERTEASAGGVNIEYYGNAPKNPLKLRIVNNGGKIYLSIDDESIQILDSTSEIKLREGVYTEVEKAEENMANIDMSKLPPVHGTHFGRLFNFGNSVKSGYSANFKKNKKSTKALRICMFLFSFVLVFMSASFGTAFKTIEDVKTNYNQNMFYVYTTSAETSNELNAAVGQHGIDNIQLSLGIPSGNGSFTVSPGRFESFSSGEASFKASADLLDIKFAGTPTVLAGRVTPLSESEVVITSTLADRLIEASTVGYVKSYADLIGLYASFYGTGPSQNGVRIVGVIESNESSVYRSSLKNATDILSNLGINVKVNKNSALEINSGETVIILGNESADVGLPVKGDTVKINGKNFTVKDSLAYYNNYENYLYEKAPSLFNKEIDGDYKWLISLDEWARLKVKSSATYSAHPNIEDYQNGEYTWRLDSHVRTYVRENFYSEYPQIEEYQWSENETERTLFAEFTKKVAEYKKNTALVSEFQDNFLMLFPDSTDVEKYQLYVTYQLDIEEYKTTNYLSYYSDIYAYLDDFIKHNYLVRPEINYWLYLEKGMTEMKHAIIYNNDYLYIDYFTKQNGRAPTYQELYESDRSDINVIIDEYRNSLYEIANQKSEEFHQSNPNAYNWSNQFYISESDYIALSTYIGESDASVLGSNNEILGGIGGGFIIMGGGKGEVSYEKAGAIFYTAIHSTDHEATKAFLSQFEGITVSNPEYQKAVYTPDGMFEDFMAEFKSTVVSNILLLIVFLAVMSLCMYFIMRSSLMTRIKEVGIYRAIGVSKGNLTFRFLIESLLLTTLTVFIGYAISSGIIFALALNVSLLDSVLYYPVWLAGAILIVLYAVCTVCGLIPIFSLLRRSPSEILSKYDI